MTQKVTYDEEQPGMRPVPFIHSVRTKFALTYILVVAIILIIMNTYPIIMAQNMVFTSKESSLKRQALTIGSALAVSETLTQEGVEQAMLLLEDLGGTRVLVTDAAAHVLYDSSTLGNRRGDYALMDEVLTALEGKKDVFRSEYRGEAFRSR
ncbi:MAG: two-component sensor histidine kinase, partial [Oscillospiraceae bacterium]|nr:two-component sensor histidine kinase [Oscillospiraceae bacterium]